MNILLSVSVRYFSTMDKGILTCPLCHNVRSIRFSCDGVWANAWTYLQKSKAWWNICHNIYIDFSRILKEVWLLQTFLGEIVPHTTAGPATSMHWHSNQIINVYTLVMHVMTTVTLGTLYLKSLSIKCSRKLNQKCGYWVFTQFL